MFSIPARSALLRGCKYSVLPLLTAASFVPALEASPIVPALCSDQSEDIRMNEARLLEMLAFARQSLSAENSRLAEITQSGGEPAFPGPEEMPRDPSLWEVFRIAYLVPLLAPPVSAIDIPRRPIAPSPEDRARLETEHQSLSRAILTELEIMDHEPRRHLRGPLFQAEDLSVPPTNETVFVRWVEWKIDAGCLLYAESLRNDSRAPSGMAQAALEVHVQLLKESLIRFRESRCR